MKVHFYQATGLLAAALILAACGGSSPTAAPVKEANDATPAAAANAAAAGGGASSIATEVQAAVAAPTEIPAKISTAAPAGNEAGGEGGGGEAALITYADATQHFSIDYPKPWTKDPAVKEGVKFDGDGTMSLVFAKADAKDVMAFATADAKTFATSKPAFKQVSLDASTEVKNAVVMGFETTGTSNVTGKTYAARGDRYYIGLSDGRIAMFTVISPVKNYDREGIRDMALTLKVTK